MPRDKYGEPLSSLSLFVSVSVRVRVFFFSFVGSVEGEEKRRTVGVEKRAQVKRTSNQGYLTRADHRQSPRTKTRIDICDREREEKKGRGRNRWA